MINASQHLGLTCLIVITLSSCKSLPLENSALTGTETPVSSATIKSIHDRFLNASDISDSKFAVIINRDWTCNNWQYSDGADWVTFSQVSKRAYRQSGLLIESESEPLRSITTFRYFEDIGLLGFFEQSGQMDIKSVALESAFEQAFAVEHIRIEDSTDRLLIEESGFGGNSSESLQSALEVKLGKPPLTQVLSAPFRYTECR